MWLDGVVTGQVESPNMIGRLYIDYLKTIR